MSRLQIRHKTACRYDRKVSLGPHRLMLRPRESRDLQLTSIDFSIEPGAEPTWARDVFGNAVATATFGDPSARLSIESVADVTISADPWPIFDIAASAITYPFLYSDDEWIDLGALTVVQSPGADRLTVWARAFVQRPGTDTLSLLKDLSDGIARSLQYEIREEEGTQSPMETLDLGRGSCRDFAVLFAEAVRSLGFGARIVSGYLFDAAGVAVGTSATGSTHAWSEVYLPGAGWITFDPTNRSLGNHNLIPVAVGRSIDQIVPVAGSYAGAVDALEEMSVTVDVRALPTTDGVPAN